MSLAERLAEPGRRQNGRPCPVCRLLDDLDGTPDDPETDRGAVERALRVSAKEGGWSAREIRDHLQAEGHDISKSSVENHRREHLA